MQDDDPSVIDAILQCIYTNQYYFQDLPVKPAVLRYAHRATLHLKVTIALDKYNLHEFQATSIANAIKDINSVASTWTEETKWSPAIVKDLQNALDLLNTYPFLDNARDALRRVLRRNIHHFLSDPAVKSVVRESNALAIELLDALSDSSVNCLRAVCKGHEPGAERADLRKCACRGREG